MGYYTKGRDKIKVKPTLYFTHEELEEIKKLRGEDWYTRSLADFIEKCVRDQLIILREKLKKEKK